jgi:hypothetical protein
MVTGTAIRMACSSGRRRSTGAITSKGYFGRK